MNFEQIISPVNRNFLFDGVNFIAEPLYLEWVFMYESAIFDGCMLNLHGAMTLRSNTFFELCFYKVGPGFD